MKPLIKSISTAVILSLSAPLINASELQGPLLRQDHAFERMSQSEALEKEAYSLGIQAVSWGMQWVKAGAGVRHMAKALPKGTNHNPADPMPHAYNVFGHAQAPITPDIKIVERGNSETPYSIAIVDLRQGPVIVTHPHHQGRYFRTSVWDIYGDTKYISQLKDGDHPKPHVLVRNGWQGQLPEGLDVIYFRSDIALLAPHIGLIESAKIDMPKIREMQKGYKLIALKDWGKSNAEMLPLSQQEQIHGLLRPEVFKTLPKELWFFEMLGQTLKDIDLSEGELEFTRQLSRIGISKQGGFDYKNLHKATLQGLKRASLDGQSILEHKARAIAPLQANSNWRVMYDFTNKDDWLFRGTVGWRYVWSGHNSEVLFPQVDIDSQGELFSGKHNYTLTFAKGQMPPANYWRISMYNWEGYFAHNPINRYGLGNMVGDKLKANADGSITIYLQQASPGKEKESNWLPTPEGVWSMMMRQYQPHEQARRKGYTIPNAVKQ